MFFAAEALKSQLKAWAWVFVITVRDCHNNRIANTALFASNVHPMSHSPEPQGTSELYDDIRRHSRFGFSSSIRLAPNLLPGRFGFWCMQYFTTIQCSAHTYCFIILPNFPEPLWDRFAWFCFPHSAETWSELGGIEIMNPPGRDTFQDLFRNLTAL